MTFAQIIPFLLNGEKVRRESWLKGHFWRMANGRFIDPQGISSADLRISVLHITATDWEVAL